VDWKCTNRATLSSTYVNLLSVEKLVFLKYSTNWLTDFTRCLETLFYAMNLNVSMMEASSNSNTTRYRVQRSRYQSHHFANFANLRICRTRPQPRPNSSGSVRVIHVHGFGSLQHIFMHVNSSSVRFCQNVGSSSVRFPSLGVNLFRIWTSQAPTPLPFPW